MTDQQGVNGRSARTRPARQLAGSDRLGAGFSTTGVRLFTALMIALLPLGILAVLGTVQTIRTVEMERVAGLSLGAAEGASRLLGEINADKSTMRLVANDLADDAGGTAICRRARDQLRDHGRTFGFAMFASSGRLLCHNGTAPIRYDNGGKTLFGQQATIVPGENGRPDTGRLIVRVNSQAGDVRGVLSYSVRELAERTGLSPRQHGFSGVALRRGEVVLPLTVSGQARPPAEAMDSAVTPLNLGGLDFIMMTERPAVDLLRSAATLLPIVMWLAAAAVGWWVVSRYLIQPLIALNRYVAAYQPGSMLGPIPEDATLAKEITVLGETFREIAADVVEHEGQLADALTQQRALTREVHHRVKNNLQIIASLINLHSRASSDPAAADAYSSIQRRVDALSVVHRNHYASAEYNQGIDAQALISELASGLRGSAPGGRMTIKVAADHLYVSQDTAVPTAFLITELVELAILGGHSDPVLLGLRRDETNPLVAELSIVSDSLKPDPDVDQLLEERFGRILIGLSRQLRAPLEYVADEGRYSITIGVR